MLSGHTGISGWRSGIEVRLQRRRAVIDMGCISICQVMKAKVTASGVGKKPEVGTAARNIMTYTGKRITGDGHPMNAISSIG